MIHALTVFFFLLRNGRKDIICVDVPNELKRN